MNFTAQTLNDFFALEWPIPVTAVIGILLGIVLLAGMRIGSQRSRKQQFFQGERLQECERKLRNSTREKIFLFDHLDLFVIIVEHKTLSAIYANPSALSMFNYQSAEELNGQLLNRDASVLSASASASTPTPTPNPTPTPASTSTSRPGTFIQLLQQQVRECDKHGIARFECQFETAQEGREWQQFTLTPTTYNAQPGVLVMGHGISEERSKTESMHARQKALTSMAKRNQLDMTLEAIFAIVKQRYRHCGIMQTAPLGNTLTWSCSQGIPDAFLAATDNMKVAYGEGSCGTAVSLNTRRVSTGMDSDMLWGGYRKIVRESGFISCWSEPIPGGSGAVLGTLVVYHRDIWQPAKADIESIAEPVYLISLAMEDFHKSRQLAIGMAAEHLVSKISTELLKTNYQEGDNSILTAMEDLGKFYSLASLYIHQKHSSEEGYFCLHQWRSGSHQGEASNESAFAGHTIDTIYSLLVEYDQCALRLATDKDLDFVDMDECLTQDTPLAIFISIQCQENPVILLEVQLHQPSESFRQNGLASMQLFSSMLKSIFVQKQLLESLQRQALRDQLTGLYNRHKIEVTLNEEINRFNRYGTIFSVVLIDIDKFKSINDTFGHNAGDEALKLTAQIIAANIRKTDFCGRWGGEEFIIILPEQSLNGALEFSGKLLNVIENTTYPIPRTVTISAGLAQVKTGDQPEIIMNRADKGLYLAKEGGRNCVKIAEAESAAS